MFSSRLFQLFIHLCPFKKKQKKNNKKKTKQNKTKTKQKKLDIGCRSGWVTFSARSGFLRRTLDTSSDESVNQQIFNPKSVVRSERILWFILSPHNAIIVNDLEKNHDDTSLKQRSALFQVLNNPYFKVTLHHFNLL